LPVQVLTVFDLIRGRDYGFGEASLARL